MDILTTATESYTQTFASFVGQFIDWGQIIFSVLLAFNFIWLCLWYAFDKESIPQALSVFIKKSFVVMLFYTFMIRPKWLISIFKTSAFMGNKLTGIPVDPSSIIANGITVANKVIAPITNSSLLTMNIGVLVAFGTYCIIIFCFTVIALDLSVTLITSSALVAVAPLFLGFSALNATSSIARQTLDVILGNAVKLLGIYLTVGAGAKTLEFISNNIPTEIISFDPYCWIVAACLLFWQVSKHLPNQLARIVSGSIHDHHGSELAAFAFAAARTAPTALKTIKMTASGLAGAATVVGSVAHNAAHRMMKSSGRNAAYSALKVAGGVTSDVTKAGSGIISDHFKNILNKSVGGPGSKATHNGHEKPIPGFSERMYQATQDFKAQSENPSGSTEMNTSNKKSVSKPMQ